jgi:Lrp/AsnC family leucine-responsive transcriptional regulator
MSTSLDANDIAALGLLQAEGRATWARIGGRLGLTGPAAAERVRRLEKRGVIRAFTAVVDPVAVGFGLTSFITVSLQHPKFRSGFYRRIAALDQVQECHHITGEDDYLLKVRSRNVADLDRLINADIKSVPGVSRTRTTVVLRTSKEQTALPLDQAANGRATPSGPKRARS